jgi:hypothetical protein
MNEHRFSRVVGKKLRGADGAPIAVDCADGVLLGLVIQVFSPGTAAGDGGLGRLCWT